MLFRRRGTRTYRDGPAWFHRKQRRVTLGASNYLFDLIGNGSMPQLCGRDGEETMTLLRDSGFIEIDPNCHSDGDYGINYRATDAGRNGLRDLTEEGMVGRWMIVDYTNKRFPRLERYKR